MRCPGTQLGQQAKRCFERADVAGLRIAQHQHYRYSGLMARPDTGFIESGLADGHPVGGRDSAGQGLERLATFGHQPVASQRFGVQAKRALARPVGRDHSIVQHVQGNARRGLRRAFATARLQHVEPSVLHGELEVLHVARCLCKNAGCVLQGLPGLGQPLGQFIMAMGASTAQHHILALRVKQKIDPQQDPPVAVSRVNPTPTPERPPVLPNTMACIVIALPIASDRTLSRQYSQALADCHEPSTAPIASLNCYRASCGNGRPTSWAKTARWRRVSSRISEKSSSRSPRPAQLLATRAAATPVGRAIQERDFFAWKRLVDR